MMVFILVSFCINIWFISAATQGDGYSEESLFYQIKSEPKWTTITECLCSVGFGMQVQNKQQSFVYKFQKNCKDL